MLDRVAQEFITVKSKFCDPKTAQGDSQASELHDPNRLLTH